MAVALAALAAIAGFANPAAAANTFNSEWADSTWTNSGRSTNVARLAPAEESHNGAITETLVTKISGTFCAGDAIASARLDVNIAETEQATDLVGVDVDTFNAEPTATVNRVTSITGTITATPTKGKTCNTVIGPPVTATDPIVTLISSWVKPNSASLVTYSGTDCGGTGTCRYTDATAAGSFVYGAHTYALTGTKADKWMWSGSWNLDATCSPVPGYPCS